MIDNGSEKKMTNEQIEKGTTGQHMADLQKELQVEHFNILEKPVKEAVENEVVKRNVKQISSGARKGFSISAKISGSMIILMVIIVLILVISFISLFQSKDTIGYIVNNYVSMARNSEAMKTTIYKILLAQKEFLQTEDAQELNAISQNVEKLKSQLSNAAQRNIDTKGRLDQNISLDFNNILQMIDSYETKSKSQSKSIQTARENISKLALNADEFKKSLFSEVEKNRQLIDGTVDDFWLDIKKKNEGLKSDVNIGQELVGLKALLLNIQISMIEFITSEKQTSIDSVKLLGDNILASAERVRNLTDNEKLRLAMGQIKTNVANYLSIFNSSVDSIKQSNLKKNESNQMISQQKKDLISQGDELIKTLLSIADRNWIKVDASKVQMDDVASNSSIMLSIVAIIGIVVGLIVLIFVPRPITTGISQLLEAASSIADGNLKQKIAISSTDELGVLSEMMEKMRINLLALVSQVSDAVINVTSLANEIMASANQQSTSSNEVAAQVTQVSSSVNEQVSSLSELNQSLAGVNKFALTSSQKSKESTEQAQVALTGMHNISTANSGASERMQLLREKIEEISKVLGVIADVADQTNMLSLNASIEATKAGESGKGFTVVAGEIRRLADRSLLSAQNINEIVHDIQRAAESAVMSMQKSSEEIRVGSESVNIAVANLETINVNISQISSQTNEMSSVVSQQSEASRIIGDSVQNINSATELSANASKQTAIAISNLNGLVNQLRRTLGQFRI